MKLLRVYIEKLHKYISTDLRFDDDLSIITGVNGSGKTQILRLIDATLRLNIDYLDEIDFSIFSLEFEHEQEIFTITIIKNSNYFSFTVNNQTIKISKERTKNSIFTRSETIKDDFIFQYQSLLASNPATSFLVFSQIRPPLLLGLNRIVENDEDERSISLKFKKTSGWVSEKNLKEKENHNDHMFNSISQCKKLIMNESESIMKYEDAQASVLRNKIIASSFDYLDGELLSPDVLANKLQNVYDRKNSIIEELEKLKINDANTNTQIGVFFNKLDKLKYNFDKNKKNEITFELLLNLSQIERVSNIISIVDENKKTMDIKREKLTLFVNTVNEFFRYTGKSIVITSLGRVFVVVNKKHKVDLEKLSSGEMQLVSIISNMIFCKNNNRGLVLIIDEPEISLHIKWQEIFIEVLQNIKKDAQLILATHSPDIIGDNLEFCRPIENKGW
ncbi:AAA family ATPase [Vibrio parahaemolyticus]|uniref:AAA family ATPase n=1 Tax=Vibrio parahaemolyticus TaxID=670 RepID=UPI00226A51EE|nr:AAA family ATPase [Vibrio parahaemolyticus]ELB2154344.1 AAA family ATPase [Vibrio parahaemolyticus]MCX8892241.1 ATP-binding protein [Vibrio parahaemolyticus]